MALRNARRWYLWRRRPPSRRHLDRREPVADIAAERFAHIAAQPEDDVDLAEAALLVAMDEYQGLDSARYLGRLDELAETVRADCASRDPMEVLKTLNRHLFELQGFRGNIREFSDPRNSFLNDVLERKLGIPITLSLLHIEVGRRLDLPVQGVSFPGHFLVRMDHDKGMVILDPFFKGASLSLEQLEERVHRLFGDAVNARDHLPGFLVAATKKQIVVRILRNLKGIYLDRGDDVRALKALSRIVTLAPDDASEVRDRGALFEKMEGFRAALDDYTRYLALAPHASDADAIRTSVSTLKQRVSRLN